MENKKQNEQLEKLRQELKEAYLPKEDSSAYKCNSCGERVSFTFPVKFLKDSGLCPDCWHKDNE